MCTVLSMVFSVFVVNSIGFGVISTVSPEDVGGQELLNSIKSDTETMISDIFNALKVTFVQKCYCKAPLERFTWKRPFNDWICTLCFANQSGRVVFECANYDNCVFKDNSGWYYRICPSCFVLADDDTIAHEMDEKEDGMGVESKFISRLLTLSIRRIS